MRSFSAPFTVLAGLLCLVNVLTGCSPAKTGSSPSINLPGPQQASSVRSTPSRLNNRSDQPKLHFTEVGLAAGLHYEWKIPGKRPLNILQTIGNGCAFLDYNNDGNLDILLIGPKLALYKGNGHGQFVDVTQATGLDRLTGHFLGCAVGDYDNDGYDDLYISGYHTGVLLHNDEGKRFQDVTKQAGLPVQPWGTSCGFADLDGDGYLDLYIANYVQFDPKTDLTLCPYKGLLTGCGPRDYSAAQGTLFHNEGGKRFRDVTQKMRMKGHGKALGVAFADIKNVGVVSLAVANDLMDGDLFENEGRGTFSNVGLLSGTARDADGQTHAGMGIDFGDYDNDGHFDLFVTTFSNETKCLYRNHGGGLFSLVSPEAGIETPTLPFVSWGCKFFDADNDGWLDLIITSGHVQDNIRKFEKESYRQPTVLLHNSGVRPVTFTDATNSSGLNALPRIVGRGLATGDYDNDGRVDVLVVDSEGRPLLLHNDSATAPESWVGFRLIGSHKSNRNAYGAVITVRSLKQRWVRQCQPTGSYLSSSDARVHFGLGSDKIDSVTIRWPDRTAQTWTGIQAGRYYTVKQGGRPE